MLLRTVTQPTITKFICIAYAVNIRKLGSGLAHHQEGDMFANVIGPSLYSGCTNDECGDFMLNEALGGYFWVKSKQLQQRKLDH